MLATDDLRAGFEVLQHGCGLVDRSEAGKLALTGADARSFLAGQVTNDTEALVPGAGCYAAFLTPKGKMLGDLRILMVDDDELLLLCERVALQGLFDLIRRFKIGFAVELHKRTVQQGLLSLVGPEARAVAGARAAGLPEHEHANRRSDIGGAQVLVVATDVGVDVVCEAEEVDGVRAALASAGAVPVDGEAAEALRVQRGRPRYGIDLDDTVIPQEAGLNERAVSFTKGCYVGQETVARLFYRGKPNRHLRQLALEGRGATGDEVLLGEKVVGRLGSVAEVPGAGWLGLALVRREVDVGSSVVVGSGGVTAQVLDLPQ